MILRGNVDGVHCRVDELEVREGGHVDAGAATVGLRNLVQLSLTRLTMFQCEPRFDNLKTTFRHLIYKPKLSEQSLPHQCTCHFIYNVS